ncbi:DDE Tnp4 domain-containing protein [Citrus sinensis]|uniref:DDE Tnp4 domain-containing protein n=1 Tax=Citrus sinensis TaxID=2711 RepID=A0ACB8LAF5_CITSI|nr:DDE Tnp4 domain-containing protein [Citrus sinensis]
MVNPKVEKFRKEGFNKELEGKLDRMFMNITTTGNKAWTPSGIIPVDDYENFNNDTIFLVEENSDSNKDMQVQYIYQGAKEKKDEKVVGLNSTQAKQIKKEKKVDHVGRKVGGATKISQQIECLVEIVENRSSTLINLQKEMNGCSFVYNMYMLDDDQEFDSIISTFMIAIDYYYYYRTYIHKQPCMNFLETCNVWLMQILKGNETRCQRMFKMEKDVFFRLCNELEINYGIKGSKRVSTAEVLGMFLHTIGYGVGNRSAQERSQHFGETTSKYFGEAVDAICHLFFKDIPEEILRDFRHMPHFKDCIGTIDGTYVHVSIPPEDQIPYIGRKGIPTQNIMAACNFDMHTHDTRIFLSTKRNPTVNFPKLPKGKYYLVDAGYHK